MNFHDPNWEKNITVTMPAYRWWSIHNTTCLGLRHSSSKKASRDSALEFFRTIEEKLLDEKILSISDINHIQNTFY